MKHILFFLLLFFSQLVFAQNYVGARVDLVNEYSTQQVVFPEL